MSFESTNLMSIAKVVTGKHDANHADENGQYRFYTCASEFSKCNTYNFQGECIILPGNGANVGDAYFYDGKFDAYQRTYVVHDIDKKRIIPKFLHYNFLHNWKTIGTAQQFGSATNYIKIGNFVNYRVACPSINIQRNAISELDLLTEIIDKQKQQLKELDTLAQSIFYDMFGNPVQNDREWAQKRIGDLCTLKSGNSSANNSEEGDLPYVKVGDMNIPENNPFITTSSTFVNRDENKKNILPIGTIVFPKRGGAIYTNKKRITAVEICCDLNIMGVIPSKAILSSYLYHYFLSIDFGKLCNGAAIPQLNNIDIAPLPIGIPPLELQEPFAKKIQAIESQKESINRSIAESQKLFDYTMDKYFG